jgi:hypothetical protein
MSNMIHKVLIVDDDFGYVQGQNDLAYQKGINLVHIDNWEDAKLELEANPDLYKAVIIDGRGKLKSESKSEDKKHLNTVISWFEEQRSKNRYFNFVVNSAFLEDFIEHIDFNQKEIRTYNKGKDEIKMYKELVKLIDAFPVYKVRNKYKEVIDIFDDTFLPYSHQETIENLLLVLEKDAVMNEPFNSMRHIVEAMCKSINKINHNFYPNVLIDKRNDTPNLTAATYVLCGKDSNTPYAKANSKVMFPSSNGLSRVFSSLVANCQAFSHDNKEPDKIPPIYAFETTLYGLMEVLIAYKNFAKKELNI